MRTNAKPLPDHSPLPWVVDLKGDAEAGRPAVIRARRLLVTVSRAEDFGDPLPDAEMIVTAVNSYRALIAALKECRKELGYMGSEFDGLVKEADEALKLAGE